MSEEQPPKRKRGRPKTKPAKYYTDKADFYRRLVEYKEACKKADKEGVERPLIPNSIGTDITNIATGLSASPNFKGYPYRDDMIQDAILDCVKAVKHFNPDKSDNPFGYFTRVASNSFVKRIKDEKKALYVKCKSGIEALTTVALYGDKHSVATIAKSNLETDYMADFMEKYEQSVRDAKAKKEEREKNSAPLNDLFD